MNMTLDWLRQLGHAWLLLWINPFYYVGILMVMLQVRRQVALERKLYYVKLHSLPGETLRAVLWGWAAGAFASAVMALVGVSVTLESLLLLWAVSAILLVIRIRFLCLAYAAGILAVLQAIVGYLPSIRDADAISWLTGPLMDTDMASLLVLVAVLHLTEALMMRRQGSRLAFPLFYESKRGRIVGGYQIQGFWPIPLFLLSPVAGGAADLPWTPWFTNAGAGSWSWLAFPAVIGFTEWTVSRLPKDKLRHSSRGIGVYAVILFAAAVAAHFWNDALGIAGLAAILLHELLILVSARREEKESPIFVHGPQGLKILAVLPGSPAAEMGIVPGEIIHKVHGIKVLTKEELHQALRVNSAFCKMEVLNLEGQSKFVSRAMFAGEHHQLGIVLCPDEHALYYVADSQIRLPFARYLHRKWYGLTENK